MSKFEVGDIIVLKAKKVYKVYGMGTLYNFMMFKGPKTIGQIDTDGNCLVENYRYTSQMLKLYTIKGKKL